MATDLRYQLLDEIALEGLEGLTINVLWYRLKERPDFKQELDDACKNYLWNCILSLPDVEFFKLKEERPELVPYNRFHYHDPETNHFLETEHVPDDIYPICLINDNGIRGSCETYKTRMAITETIRGPEKRLSLTEAAERYGNKLVMVATQSVRWRTIVGEENDPNIYLTDMQYCVLERVARSRYYGETTIGKLSLQAFNESSKTLFYIIKKLRVLDVLKKQGITYVRKASNFKAHCILYHLKRFYFTVHQKWKYELFQIADYVAACPGRRAVAATCKEDLKYSRDQDFKKAAQRTSSSGERYMRFIDLPYREVYPDARPKDYISKTHKTEKFIRHIELLRHPRGEENESDDEDQEQLNEKVERPKFEPVYDKPCLAQVYEYIKKAKDEGISQTELQKYLKKDKLSVRRQLKMLQKQGSVKTVIHDVGRQKIILYIAKDAVKENINHKETMAEMKKFEKITAPKLPKSEKRGFEIKLSVEPPSDARANEIKEELEKVELTTPFCKPLNPNEEKAVEEMIKETPSEVFKDVTIEESAIPVNVFHNKRPTDKVGMERFGNLLTQTHIRRANWIIETVQAIKLLEQFKLRKLLRRREEEMNLQYCMDAKSLQRLINALIEDKKVRSMKATIKIGEKVKILSFVCDMDITIESSQVKRAVEEAKLKHFSVSREALKGAMKKANPETKAETKAEKTQAEKKKLGDHIPLTARDSISKYQSYRKMLQEKPPEMKYSRKAGIDYGLLPKMVRSQRLHQFLWYLCYETYGKNLQPLKKDEGNENQGAATSEPSESNALEKIDLVEHETEQQSETIEEPPKYLDEFSWKRYLPSLTCHEGYPKGWCFISDVLLQMPVCLFCELVNICYDIEGLKDILKHPTQRFYPVISLPFRVASQLLFAKKYVHSFFDQCVILCEMGLVTFGKDVMKEKEQTFLYLHKKGSIIDTRDSLPGYNKTHLPPDFEWPRKRYQFDSEIDVSNYWEDFQVIAFGSNLGYKFSVKRDEEDDVSHEELALDQALLRKSPSEVVDEGKIPGDMRGACGLNATLFCHAVRNWLSERNRNRYRDLKKYHNRYLQKDPEDDEKVVIKVTNSVKANRTSNVKGNRGGKGVKKHKDPGIVPSSRSRAKILVKAPKVDVPKKKRLRFEKDAKDDVILGNLNKQRVTWTANEDSILLICNIASILMEESRRKLIVSYPVLRDILHEKLPNVATEKTSNACARRLNFILHNVQTKQNMHLFLEEATRDQHVKTEYMDKSYVATYKHLVVPQFRSLVDYLLNKFQSLDVTKCELPENLSQLDNIRIEGSARKTKKIYSDVTSKTDVCQDVLRNILHSLILLQDKQGRAHEMFKLLSQYPEHLLSDVILELRRDGLFVLHKGAQPKMKSKITAGVGLRSFKASQRYMYNYKQRNLSTLFDECAQFLDNMVEAYSSDREDKGVNLSPQGCQSPIVIPLMLMKKLNFKVTMPEELVIVDLDGFYHFPWGRGKMCSKSDKFKMPEGSEDLGELFPGLPKEVPIPKESTPARLAATLRQDTSTETVNHDGVNAAAESSEVAPEGMIIKDKGSSHCNVKDSEEETDKEIDDNPDSVTKLKDTAATSSNPSAGKETSQKVEGSKDSLKFDDASRQESIVEETLETAKNATSDIEKISAKENTDTEYTVHKHGCSELAFPAFEGVKVKEIQPEQHTIASRTLLSLRRSDDAALDDIRIFNAQDNFVVNSCTINLQLRPEEELDSCATDTMETGDNVIKCNEITSEMASEMEVSELSHVREKRRKLGDKSLRRGRNDGETKSEKERERIMGRLLLKKETTKQIAQRLQQIYPFQLDMQTVWKHLKAIGLTEAELDQCQQVYSKIQGGRELGIKLFDLKKCFPKEFPWRQMVDILMEQQAKNCAADGWRWMQQKITRVISNGDLVTLDMEEIEDGLCPLGKPPWGLKISRSGTLDNCSLLPSALTSSGRKSFKNTMAEQQDPEIPDVPEHDLSEEDMMFASLLYNYILALEAEESVKERERA